VTWDGDANPDFNWTNGLNWDTDTVPGKADTAYVEGNTAATAAVINSTVTDVNNFRVGNSGRPP